MRTRGSTGGDRSDGVASGTGFSIPGDRQTRFAGVVGAGGSFVVHAVVLSVLAIWMLEQFSEDRPLSTEWSQSEEGPVSLPESVAGELEVASQDVQQMEEVRRIDTAIVDGREHVLDDALSDALLEYAVESRR